MRISKVEAFLLSYPLPQPLELDYYGGRRTIVKRDAMLVRIQADNGLVGYGPAAASERWKERIEQEIAAFLHGRVLADPDALRVRFVDQHGGDAELLKIYSCLEIALYDLAGKARGLPVSEFLGGRIRDTIRLYGSAGMYMEPEGYAAEAKLCQQLGFSAYKMRPALGPETDLETVRKMRKATGPGFGLMVDAHTWWRMGDRSYSQDVVEQLASKMSEYDLVWLEEPLDPHQHEAYRKLKARDLVPLASGEHEPDEEGFLDLLNGPCVDYVQMDLVCQGGFSWGRRLFGAVQAAGLRFAFHSWGTALELIAAAQLGICWPEQVVEWLEYPCYSTPEKKFMYPWPLAEEILAQPLEIVDGHLVVPAKPGLGVEVNESVIEKYPWIPGPWSYFSLTSPKQTFAVTADHSVKMVF
ncbi:MAG: mandelate racemase/muconate lactonizing enzyme family protein [Bryobacteraceae bacterium]|nr:mandelate racemase/muconate lactonizing enzyme family protein [Bryobacteraceae bacterium]MDW8377399.1 mandelate racemase/muconate lactonizing enzyme family protein [Bryobacterales bacterium]